MPGIIYLFLIWVLGLELMSSGLQGKYFTNWAISVDLELYAFINDQIKRTYCLGVDLLYKLDRFVSWKINVHTLPFVMWLLKGMGLSYMVLCGEVFTYVPGSVLLSGEINLALFITPVSRSTNSFVQHFQLCSVSMAKNFLLLSSCGHHLPSCSSPQTTTDCSKIHSQLIIKIWGLINFFYSPPIKITKKGINSFVSTSYFLKLMWRCWLWMKQ